ncbi:MAG: hypothetical protein IH991_06735 [Planctomycetes bacterium]|nr:hypothetical protein [Planctomycetota bacterium]
MSISIYSRLGILNYDDGLIQRSVCPPQIRIDVESDSPTTSRALEQIAGDLFVFLPRNFFTASGTWIDISVMAGGADSWQYRPCNVATILTFLTDVFLNNGHINALRVAVITDYAFYFAEHVRREFKIGVS